jgi:cytochrome c nitrite reductase small subunit
MVTQQAGKATAARLWGVPAAGWISFAVLLGLAAGVGLFTFGYAQGASYLTNDPAACANCHVMRDHYAGWMKGSHGNVAVCNDCHSPSGLLPKYYTKARNGFFHSVAFTTGWFPDNIRINEFNYGVTQNACAKCHQQMVSTMDATRGHGEGANCIECHHNVGHE